MPFAIQIYDNPASAPAFTLKDPAGETVKLADYSGKILLINFWATWCIPCVKEMPEFQKLNESLKGEKFAFLGIDVMDSKARVDRFLKTKNISLPIAMDKRGEIYPKYGVKNFPTTVIIGKNGKVLGRMIGIREWATPESIQYFKDISRL